MALVSLAVHPIRTASRCSATLVVVALLAAACTDDGGGSGGKEAPHREPRFESGTLKIAADETDIDAPYVVENRLYGLPENESVAKLAGVVNSSLIGTLAPAAVVDPSGRYVAYHSFTRRRPVLRVHDLKAHDDSLLAQSAFSLAWAERGIAYFKGLEPRVEDPLDYLGHVFVRSSLRGRAKRWTDAPARYAASAWAGDRLIVHRMTRAWPDLLVFEGPRRARVLAEDAALIAVSPDGSLAFVTKRPSPAPVVSVVRVADGRTLASLDLDDVSTEPSISYVADSGSWAEDEIVAAVSGGLAVFRFHSDSITLEQALRVSPKIFPTGVLEPRADASGRRIVTWGGLAPRPRAAVGTNVILECDRTTLRCARGRSIAVPLAPRAVLNPSRP